MGRAIESVREPAAKVDDRDPHQGLLILLVDDEDSVLYTLEAVLKREGYRTVKARSGGEGLALWRTHRPDLLVSDYNMPGMNGVELLRAVKQLDADALVIMMTAYGSEALAVEAMKEGAYDYLSKPFANDDLKQTIRRALERIQLGKENRELKLRLRERAPLEKIVGQSEPIRRVFELIEKVAPLDVTVLITGESGTGKELVASAIHGLSPRRDGPFIRVNCAALPETLIESELFGFEKGAFTGAVARRQGKFELADGGTIFLDEIGDMSLATQTKILRILQEREFERVGGHETIKVDTRVLAATNRDLAEGIRNGTFREDLFYRLNVVTIQLPPLRERRSDIPLLLDHFGALFRSKFGKTEHRFSEQFLSRLLQYPWPGNVREFQNLIERAIILDDENLFGDASAGSFQRRAPLENTTMVDDSLLNLTYREAKEMVLNGFDRKYFENLLNKAEHNISRAAAKAGMHRKNLYMKLKEIGLLARDRDPGDGSDGFEPASSAPRPHPDGDD